MALTKVYNDNNYDYTERYKGEMLTIPAKGYIEMEWEEGVQFAGQMGRGLAPIGANGKPDPRYFKMIRAPWPEKPIVADDAELINHATGQKALSRDDLADALDELSGQRSPADNGEITAMKEALAKQQAMIDELLAERKKGK